MATQVEALLPGAPLLPAEERALVLKPPQDGGREKGEQQQQQQQPQQQQPMGPDGGPAAPRPPSAKQQKEESNNQEKESLLRGAEPEEGGEAGGGGGAGGRREFIEAPPPKVNPWTKNAAALAVNGQSPPDIFPADGQSGLTPHSSVSCFLEKSLKTGAVPLLPMRRVTWKPRWLQTQPFGCAEGSVVLPAGCSRTRAWCPFAQGSV